MGIISEKNVAMSDDDQAIDVKPSKSKAKESKQAEIKAKDKKSQKTDKQMSISPTRALSDRRSTRTDIKYKKDNKSVSIDKKEKISTK